MGGSEYFRMKSENDKKEYFNPKVPRVNAENNLAVYRSFSECTAANLISSAIPSGAEG